MLIFLVDKRLEALFLDVLHPDLASDHGTGV